MHYGVSTQILSHHDLESALRRIAEAGFTQIEISTEPPHFYPGTFDPDIVRGWLGELGLHAPVGHGLYSHASPNAAALDEADRHRSVQFIRRCFEPLVAIGVDIVVLHPTGYAKDYVPQHRQRHVEQAQRSMEELAHAAGDLGLCIAWENLPHHGTERPLHDMRELRQLIEEMPPHVGLCLDTTHTTISGHDPVEQAQYAGDRLFCLHLHDTDGQHDCHWVPGCGITDWPAFLAQLDVMDFRGPRTLEVISNPEAEADTLAKTVEVARQWGNP